MIIVRLLLIIVSFIVSLATITGVMNIPSSPTGLLNTLLIGIGLFAVFVANCLAQIISFKKDDKSKQIANRITSSTIGVALLLLVGPSLVDLIQEFSNQ